MVLVSPQLLDQDGTDDTAEDEEHPSRRENVKTATGNGHD